MASLWKATVEAVDGTCVALRVHAVHPDAGDVPDSPEFALRLLADGLERAAGASEAARRLETPGVQERARQVVGEVAVTERRNHPFSEQAAQAAVADAVRARGLDPADGSAGEAAFAAEWTALWDDPSRTPGALLTVGLHDAGAVAGLRSGDSWESAAFG
ncbi:hypothetical protein [Streptomyces sp. NPDC021224]|uniref:hypothetical protein n=1 Tax=unclassified Streptomyces TaxID=2593676 RepID=UPI0037A325AB